MPKRTSPWLIIDIALKAVLVGLLLYAVLVPNSPQFEGKAMAGRAATYPLAALIVPVLWWLRWHTRPYPVAVDILIVLPFLIDTVGNALDLYDSVSWWDDANHFVNWALLTSGALLALQGVALAAWNRFALGSGFGAITAILWELIEFVMFIKDSPERATAYTDTLGDLALGLAGATLASLVISWWGHKQRS